MKGVSLLMLMKVYVCVCMCVCVCVCVGGGAWLKSIRIRAGHQKKHMIRGLKLLTTWPPEKGKGLEAEFNQRCLHNKTLIQNSGQQDLGELPGWWTYWCAGGWWTCLGSMRRGCGSSVSPFLLTPLLPPRPHSMHLFHLAVPKLYLL